MGRVPHCSKDGLNKGSWTSEEDNILIDYVKIHGEGKWSNVSRKTGLKRCGKSCRLRWLNYLRPDIKRGNISLDEEELIVRLHKLLGNRWSLIAGRLPGRTDNEIKNYWNTNLAKKALDSYTLSLPKLDHQPKPPSPSPNAPTKPDTNTATVQRQPEKDQTLQHVRTINLEPFELNNNVVHDSDRIYEETVTADQFDASPSSISGDVNRYQSDQLMHMDFNMDELSKILAAELEEEGREVGDVDVVPKKLESWSGKSDECAQAENSDFMSLISFLDSEWQEII